ncbi:multi-sensor signal transduction histidine kinase [Thalassoporum mexicanum PCC 7367]|uniref:PAS domain S-box protein n=1 Tax=Thalassoporum mexicanum TaxID=3457544 RepID=UPI00029FF4FD|nr:PAS domain S-box protein [Pseudanabaena sp. PCC 7367]AFY71480.1 multi-sensor signal transduction histidine kinase [Pseudanabaena sp. PCC 7367]
MQAPFPDRQDMISWQTKALEILSCLNYRGGKLSEYLDTIAKNMSVLVGLDWSVVTLCDEQKGSDRILASSIDIGAAAEKVYELHGTLTNTVVNTGEPLVVEDTNSCTQYGQAPEGYQAYLGVPMRTADGNLIGTICSFHRSPRQFSADEVQLATIFAERAANAIDNYQLYQMQQELNQKLATEIEERKEAEIALKASEKRFRNIFEFSNDAIFILDPGNDKIILANPKASQLLGYSTGELKTLSISQVHPEEMAKLKEFGDLVYAQGYGWTDELFCLGSNGEKIDCEISASPIEIGDRTCILALVRDIRARKHAEKALRDSEMRFRTLVENAADSFLLINSAGQLLDVNQSACDTYGYSREEMCQLSIADIETKYSLAQIEEIRRQFSCDQPHALEGIHRRRDGSVFPAEARISLFESVGETLELALVRDISDRLTAERALRHLAEIGELATMIVHEVRNPLTTVLMGLNFFKRLELEQAALKRLNLASSEGDRLKRLLNEILLYAKEPSLEKEYIEIGAYVEKILETLQDNPTVMSHQIQFTTVTTPLFVKADADKIKQVIINLVTNACEASPIGSKISVTIEPDRAAVPPCCVYINVQNGGEPIPPAVLPKLTKPFFTTKSAGNGLGLAIVSRIIEAHNGELVITSTEAKGTVVRVQLPISTNANQN